MKSPSQQELTKAFQNLPNIQAVAERFNTSWKVVRCWLRWTKINLRPTKDVLLEDCINMTDKEMGLKYKVSDKTICVWKKQYGISKKVLQQNLLPASLTDFQKDIINGKLLGDSWIGKIRGRSKNTAFSVEQKKDHEEYVLAIHEAMLPFSLPIRYRTRNNALKTKTHHKQQVSTCLFNTKQCSLFTELRKKWYPNGFKIVPRDLVLTWRTIAYWYCDDGSNLLGKKCIRRHGVLCTNGFAEDDVCFLVSKLKEKNIECYIGFSYNQPLIYLHKNTFMHFLENIEPYITWKCMKYKLVKNMPKKEERKI